MPESSPDVPFYLSKTVIINAIIAVCALVPAAKDWVSQNPGTALAVVSAVGIALRWITHGRIVLQ